MKLNSLSLIIPIFLVVCTHVAQPKLKNKVIEKPGRCPEEPLITKCFIEIFLNSCWNDYDCAEDQKCCVVDCKQQCVSPIYIG